MLTMVTAMWISRLMPQATTALALSRQLVNQAGVPQDKIVVYEAIRVIPDRIYVPCHAEFPGVVDGLEREMGTMAGSRSTGVKTL